MPVKKKAKTRKKATRKLRETKPGPPQNPVIYFVDEVPTTLTTQEMQDRANELGKDGWRLMFVGQYGGEPNTVRVWYQKEVLP